MNFKTKKGTLYTSYFAKLNKAKGTTVCVSRFKPNFVNTDLWLKDLAPSKELLNEYKNNEMKWERYTEKYYKHLQDNIEAVIESILVIISILESGQDVTMYCYEKSGYNCHRHLIAEIISEQGFNTEEIDYV